MPVSAPTDERARCCECDRVHAMDQDCPARVEAELSDRIAALESELSDLYARRAGMMRGAGPDNGWCVCCGRELVHPIDGEDTCPTCIHAL